MNLSNTPPPTPLRPLFLRPKPLLFLTFIVLVTICILALYTYVVRPYLTLVLEQGITPSAVAALLSSHAIPLPSHDGRINILVLGVPGGKHEGKDLTDSMLVFSIDTTAANNVIIALPRDIWSPTLKDKINTAYHYGEERHPYGGMVLAKATVTEITGLPIDYVAVLDFSSFTRIIDAVGGVDVVVEQSFTDPEFPIAGKENDLCSGDPHFRCRYKEVSFKQGTEHMDGVRALEFVRSRHAGDDEGTDYARARRQEAVIAAVKKKLMQKELFFDTDKVANILAVVRGSIQTDLLPIDALALAKTVVTAKTHDFRRLTIPSEGRARTKEDIFIVAPVKDYQGRWVLVPRDGNFSTVHTFIRCQLSPESCN